MRPWLRHGVVSVGRREQACGHGERGGRSSAVVARAVEAFVVAGRDGGERGEERRAAEDALGVIRMQPYPLPVVR
jgi:hypothetical protein